MIDFIHIILKKSKYFIDIFIIYIYIYIYIKLGISRFQIEFYNINGSKFLQTDLYQVGIYEFGINCYAAQECKRVRSSSTLLCS
jgi:hypothetical protein